MKFEVRRTSSRDNKPPCEDAIKVDEYRYTIEIKTLKELISLYEKYGDLVISEGWMREKGDPKILIEIYDDYRE